MYVYMLQQNLVRHETYIFTYRDIIEVLKFCIPKVKVLATPLLSIELYITETFFPQ